MKGGYRLGQRQHDQRHQVDQTGFLPAPVEKIHAAGYDILKHCQDRGEGRKRPRYGWGFDHYLKEANTGEGIKMPGGVRFYEWKRSMPQDMIFSNTARIVEKAANVINTKNSVPHTRPPTI